MTKLRFSTESLQQLLVKYVQGEALTPNEDAPEWIHELASAFKGDLGLLALHGKQGLAEHLPNHPAIRIDLCAADNLLLLIAYDAIKARKHIGIALPPGTVMLPLLMVCKTLLGDLLERNEALGTHGAVEGIRERGGVLIVSPDVELRSRYFSMRVGAESVVDSYQACRMRPDGSVISMSLRPGTKSPTSFSVCFFLARQKHLPDVKQMAFRPAVVLLDLTHDNWIDRLDTVLDWCLGLRDAQDQPATVLVLHPYGDRTSSDVLRRHDVEDFPLNPDGIQDLVGSFAPVSLPSDSETLEYCTAWSLGPYVHARPLDRAHNVIYVPDQIASDVTDTVSSIYLTLDAMQEHFQSHRDVRLARWLVGTLLQLPIPVEWYEQTAYLMGNRQMLKRLIAGIGSGGTGSTTPGLAPVLQSVRGHLDLLYRHLSSANPKSLAFLHYVNEALAPLLRENQQVLYLARNDVIARALWPWLLSEGVDNVLQPYMRVLPYRGLDGRVLYERVVVTGPWPTRYRWQIGGRLGRSLDFLLYRKEVLIVEQQVGAFYGERARAYAQRRRFSMLHSFHDIRDPVPPDVEVTNGSTSPFVGLEIGGSQPTSRLASDDDTEWGHDLSPDVRSLFAEVSLDADALLPPGWDTRDTPLPVDPPAEREHVRWATDDEADYPEEADVGGIPAPGMPTEDCIRLTVRPLGGYSADDDSLLNLYLEADDLTECYLPNGEDDGLATILNSEIEPGFVLVRTDADDRQGLFERIVQLADSQPTMKYLATWRQYWLDAIDTLIQRHTSGHAMRRDYRGLQRQLASAGLSVTEQTVRSWALGIRIGPASANAIRVVGVLAEHPMLLQYPGQVDKALNQIRSIHRALGRRISGALQRLGKRMQRGEDGAPRRRSTTREVQLDPQLAVPIDDLIDLLQFYEVIDVDTGPWHMPAARVGVLLKRPGGTS